MSCAVFAVWRPCFVRVLSTVYVMCCFCCLATMFRVGFVNSVCHVLCLLSGDHASCESCRQCMSLLFLLSGDHASCGSCRQCMSCVVFTVWQPCFVRVLSTVYVMCCFRPCFVRVLSTVYVMCCFCCVATMLRAGLVDSVCHVLCLLSGDHASCDLLTVYVMCCFCYLVIMFVRELLTVYIMYYCCCHILTLPSGNHASCRYLMLLWPSGNHASCQHFVIYILLVLSVRSSYCYRLFIWLCTYINDCMTV